MHGAFSRPVLKEYAQHMNPMIEGGIAGWGRDGQLLAFPAFKALTLDIAASIFVGAELGSGNRPMNEAFERMVVASMSRIRLPLPWLEFQRGRQGRAFMMQFLGERMAERRRNPGGDIFSRLCQAETEEGDRFSDQEIIDHMIFLMMAAHDTTTSTLTSLTYELAKNPDWQERIREESRALDTPQPGSEDLERLPSLTLAMRETLRLYPALPVIPRIAVRDFEFGGYQIPGGSMVIVSPIVTHRLKEWWSNPDRFDPERFSNARREHERHTHSWVPFGGGPHMCLGLRFAEAQVRLIMHQMVLRYRWTVPEGYSMPVQQAPISKPRDGLPISIELVH
jgi:cytochrome P450